MYGIGGRPVPRGTLPDCLLQGTISTVPLGDDLPNSFVSFVWITWHTP